MAAQSVDYVNEAIAKDVHSIHVDANFTDEISPVDGIGIQLAPSLAQSIISTTMADTPDFEKLGTLVTEYTTQEFHRAD